MGKSFYWYVQQLWKQPKENLGMLWKERLIQWRKDPMIKRIERPTRIDRARRLGWKPIQGIILVRVRVRKGSRKREDMPRSRRTKSYYWYRNLEIPLQVIAETRANKKYPNMEVLGSYYVGEDGRYKWYEIILVDPSHPAVKSREEYSWLANKAQRKRVFRGLTPRMRRRLKEVRKHRK